MFRLLDSVLSRSGTARSWIFGHISLGRDLLVAYSRSYVAGIMIGSSAAAWIFWNSSGWPTHPFFWVTTITAFAFAALKFIKLHAEKVQCYYIPTALTILAFAVPVLHDHNLQAWEIVRWFPVYVSTTLLAGVNVTPMVHDALTKIGEGFAALAYFAHTHRSDRDLLRDSESTALMSEISQQEYLGHAPLGAQVPLIPMGHRAPRATATTSTVSDISIELEDGSISTTSTIAALVNTINRQPDSTSQEVPSLENDPAPRHSFSFPKVPSDTAQSQLPEVPGSVRSPSPGEDHFMEPLDPLPN